MPLRTTATFVGRGCTIASTTFVPFRSDPLGTRYIVTGLPGAAATSSSILGFQPASSRIWETGSRTLQPWGPSFALSKLFSVALPDAAFPSPLADEPLSSVSSTNAADGLLQLSFAFLILGLPADRPASARLLKRKQGISCHMSAKLFTMQLIILHANVVVLSLHPTPQSALSFVSRAAVHGPQRLVQEVLP